uniref:Uncharacterized protein n=1 Tax=Pseudonaja textilis TaxID=8673 RepID=A0A670XU49_PSETE
MSNYWRLILCKEAGNCNCFSADSQPNEEKDDTEHRIVVSDILQLVQDKQKVPATQPGMILSPSLPIK